VRKWIYSVQIAAFLTGNAILTSSVQAQTYTVLKSFGILTNVTGTYPDAGLVQGPDGVLYGAASGGGVGSLYGTVFRLNSDGTGFMVLKMFTNSFEGQNPTGGLLLSGGTLYGTTEGGGTNGSGTVFKLNTNGSGFSVLKHFNGNDGGTPRATLTLSGSTLYGTTYEGGSDDDGTVFKVNTDGGGFAVLKEFTTSNDDGNNPLAQLVLSGSTLYGTTEQGGTNGAGTVFKVNTDGNGYTVLVPFADNPDGAGPTSGLILSGQTLYGTTQGGGTNGSGTVYKLNTNGSGYTVLRSFGAPSGDAVAPYGRVVLSGSTLFGTTYNGGTSERGTVFKLNTNGSGYAVLRSFGVGEGYGPVSELVASGATLYGTTRYGGNSDVGTVFKVDTNGGSFATLKHFITHTGDGANPAGLALSGGTLYGTTSGGGTNNSGTIFAVSTNGAGFTFLRKFPPLASGINSDGAHPSAGLVLSGNTLHGTTSDGGLSGFGTVFKVNTDGNSFTVLKSFPALINNTNNSGANSYAGLTLAGNTFFGTAYFGGSGGNGTVFKVNTDGGSFAVLKHFSPLTNFITNDDGAHPQSGLVLCGSTLYGTALEGGAIDGNGTVFKVDTNGTGFSVLRHFAGFPSDGGGPVSGLTLSGATLYGTTYYGGSTGDGTVFKINTNGSGYSVLKEFTGSPFDGRNPAGDLVLSGNTLYGTTQNGGSSSRGTVFQINTNGGSYAILKHFTGHEGANPVSALTLSGNVLYGTTSEGGELGLGTIFKIDLAATPPPLSITLSNANVIIAWPSPSTGFNLQQNTNGIASVNWSNVIITPTDNGTIKYIVVNPPIGNRFYRLVRP
jgi:uncharacterized repeat protein (TIGR03803 family)